MANEKKTVREKKALIRCWIDKYSRDALRIGKSAARIQANAMEPHEK